MTGWLRGLGCRLACAARDHRQSPAVITVADRGVMSLVDRQLLAVALLTAARGPEVTRAADVCDVLDGLSMEDLLVVAGTTALYATGGTDDRQAREFLQYLAARLSWAREFGETP